MKPSLFFILIFSLLFIGCSYKDLEPISYTKIQQPIDYTLDIKPILDSRCVVCHSCYNAPCQMKLSSYEGVTRGASKIDMYANRLEAIDPTRLFVDAKTPKQWQDKGFYSVTSPFNNQKNDSIMMQFLNQKQKYPKSIGEYSPEDEDLKCTKDQEQMQEYFDESPHKGMPYGMPQLNRKEYNLLANWLDQGAKGTPKIEPSYYNHPQIVKWELFFNKKDLKTQMTARYIYEHLYLAHLQFESMPKRFFKLVRSKTPMGQAIELLPTRLVYNKPNASVFYYRFEEVTSTLVHKTHMVYKLNPKKLQRYKTLFLKPQWIQDPYEISYETKIAANALKAFEQIPPASRYQFLLDDIHFFIMTFIRGPVCRGQVALNVINDHFWVTFLDPKYDLSIKDRFFLHDNLRNLVIPNEEGVNPDLLNSFDMIDYAKDTIKYYKNRNDIYAQYYPKGLPLDAIWKGNANTPTNDAFLTIYRHFNSASVHKGAWGNIPRTLWVIDYPLLERIYYSLVAGYDVFGNITQGLLVRKYMDRLRIEGESNFLEFLPKNSRKPLFASWYQGWLAQELSTYTPSSTPNNISFSSLAKPKEHKNILAKMFLAHTNTPKDTINYVQEDIDLTLPKEYHSKADIEKALKILSVKSKIVQKINSFDANLAYIRINMPQRSYVYTMVINRWHNNVALLFDEEDRLNPQKDGVDYIAGFVGSYPNYFMEVDQKDLYDFFDIFQNYEATPANEFKLLKFGINRAHNQFWQKYDWFQERFNEEAKEKAGLFDLNRYYKKAIY